MHKNAQKLSEKLRTKFPATTLGYSMVKIARLDDAFLEECVSVIYYIVSLFSLTSCII